MLPTSIFILKLTKYAPAVGCEQQNSHKKYLDRGQYQFQPIKFVNSVASSPCETQPYYYMAVSHKDWELPNSRIWLAEIDIDRGLDFPI